MKNKRFIQAMGEIDDRLLERYEKIEQNLPRKKAYKSVWIKYASLAACLCIIFASVFLLQRERGFGGDTPAIVGSNSETYTQAGTIGGVNERPTQAGTIGGVNERPTQAGTTSGYIADELPEPPPIFSTVNADEYKNFAKSKELPIKIFSLDDFACFGVFDYFSTCEITDYSELSMTYRFQFASISVYGKSTFNMNAYTTWYGDIYIEEEDLHSLFYLNPERQWLANSNDDKSIYLAYKDKYGITSKDRCLHFKITDTVALRWHRSELNSLPVIVFEFDDYQMEISLSPEYETQEDGALIYSNPTIQALLTKSTAKETAEELYALWKDALK